jgi:hypothetical protein
MQNSRRLFALWLWLALTATLTLAGCGGDGTSSESTRGTQSTAVQTPTAPPPTAAPPLVAANHPPAAPPAQTLAQLEAADYANSVILIASHYGIAPGNAATVNDARFAALHTAMIASPGTIWRVIFSPGTHQYTNNRWLWGVNNVIIDAYGTSFQCTNTVSYFNGIPLQLRDLFDLTGNIAGSNTADSTTYSPGYTFTTTSPGSFSITLTTASNASNFTAGMRVFLGGYNQQTTNSWPPNLRYFEFKTVASSNSTTGVVTFTEMVKNFYDSRWWDAANGGSGSPTINAGAPRIWSLQQTNLSWAHLIWIRGATFLANSTTSAWDVLNVSSADLFILQDVVAPSISPSAVNQAYLWGDTVIGQNSEFDKDVDTVIVDGGEYASASGAADSQTIGPASGVTNLIIRNTKSLGSLNVSPRHLQIENTDIVADSTDYACIYTTPGWGVDSMVVLNTHCYAPSSGLLAAANSGWPSSGTATAGTGSSGQTIEITFSTAGDAMAQNLSYGSVIHDTTNGSYGPVNAIYYSSPNLIVTIDNTNSTWPSVSSGDSLEWSLPTVISDGGGNTLNGEPQTANMGFWQTPSAVTTP